jgi:uncharacterized OsmC-like protein
MLKSAAEADFTNEGAKIMNNPARVADDKVNGICLRRYYGSIDAIRENPDLSEFRFRSRSQWLDGASTRSIVKDFYGTEKEHRSRHTPFVVNTDMPGVFDGEDSAASPLEQLLVALGSCVTTTLVLQAAIRGVHIDSLDIRIEGDIDLQGFLCSESGVKKGYRQIRLQIYLEADTPDSELDAVIELGTNASPVFDTISCGTPITVSRLTSPGD